jgi:hypothetical protein
MRGEANLRIKQFGEYRLFAINDSGESINNREYLLELEVKFEEPYDTKFGAWNESIRMKQKNLFGLPFNVGRLVRGVAIVTYYFDWKSIHQRGPLKMIFSPLPLNADIYFFSCLYFPIYLPFFQSIFLLSSFFLFISPFP